jgi:uncharacterized membrane protein
MNLRRFYLVGGIALAIQAAIAAWGFALVGPGAIVPIHWNVQGTPDGFGPALFSFLVIPAVTAAVVVLMGLVPRIEPRRENLRRSASAYRTVAFGVVLLMTVIQVVVVLAGTGHDVNVGFVVGGGVGLLFVAMGNVLTTVRSNFMFGVRTPWTLASDRSWDRTHRLVGRLFVVTGLAMVLIALTGQLVAVMVVLIGGIAISLAWGTWYSFRVWQADPDRRPTGDAS